MKKTAIYISLLVLGSLAFAAGCGDGKKPANNGTAANRPVTQQTVNPAAPLGAQPPNMLGSPNASVTIEEFADFQCPTCAQIHNVLKNVQAAYGSRIKFVFRNYPLTQIHKNAFDAAVASEAAGRQGKFWDMQNIVFQNQQAWSNSTDVRTVFNGYAEKLGLDVERFKSDMAGMETKERVQRDMERGKALNVTSTPTIIINGQSVPFEQMNLESLRQIIDAELAKNPAPQQTVAPTSSPSASNASKPAANANTAKPAASNKSFTDQ
ncbi:MAG: thioredoxin domain-containing protein [Acidobacteria bacterium]|nr:thioredoxin domain-containing protein [Acidobacteriota bacterium]